MPATHTGTGRCRSARSVEVWRELLRSHCRGTWLKTIRKRPVRRRKSSGGRQDARLQASFKLRRSPVFPRYGRRFYDGRSEGMASVMRIAILRLSSICLAIPYWPSQQDRTRSWLGEKSNAGAQHRAMA